MNKKQIITAMFFSIPSSFLSSIPFDKEDFVQAREYQSTISYGIARVMAAMEDVPEQLISMFEGQRQLSQACMDFFAAMHRQVSQKSGNEFDAQAINAINKINQHYRDIAQSIKDEFVLLKQNLPAPVKPPKKPRKKAVEPSQQAEAAPKQMVIQPAPTVNKEVVAPAPIKQPEPELKPQIPAAPVMAPEPPKQPSLKIKPIKEKRVAAAITPPPAEEKPVIAPKPMPDLPAPKKLELPAIESPSTVSIQDRLKDLREKTKKAAADKKQEVAPQFKFSPKKPTPAAMLPTTNESTPASNNLKERLQQKKTDLQNKNATATTS